MNQQDFARRIDLLDKFVGEKNKRKFLESCDDLCIHTLCELCFNILRPERELPLNTRTLRKLKPLRPILHKLANPRLSIKSKRYYLSNQLSDYYPTIKKTVIPTLKKKYNNNLKSSQK